MQEKFVFDVIDVKVYWGFQGLEIQYIFSLTIFIQKQKLHVYLTSGIFPLSVMKDWPLMTPFHWIRFLDCGLYNYL